MVPEILLPLNVVLKLLYSSSELLVFLPFKLLARSVRLKFSKSILAKLEP